MSEKKRITRREFLKKSSVDTVAAAGLATSLGAGSAGILRAAPPAIDRLAMVAALGDTLIPTAPGYPGYKRLEIYGISKEVLQEIEAIKDADLETFNASSSPFWGGKTFLELDENQRADYFRLIIDGSKVSDKQLQSLLQRIYRLVRVRVFTVFYRNFPENKVERDAQGVPRLGSRDPHQIINPNTQNLVTGWDIANFRGPLSWAEEEQRRARFQKIHWHEG